MAAARLKVVGPDRRVWRNDRGKTRVTAAAHEAGPFSVVLLAGGRGTRLGRRQGALCLEGETLLERVWRGLAPLSDDLVGVGRAGQPCAARAGRPLGCATPCPAPGCRRRCWPAWPRRATLVVSGGLRHAVRLAGIGGHLAAQRPGHDAVVRRLPWGLEPLHAFNQRRCAAALYARCCAASTALPTCTRAGAVRIRGRGRDDPL
jgi:hypothetical protein